jgi:hypothetical protein
MRFSAADGSNVIRALKRCCITAAISHIYRFGCARS